MRNKEKNNWLLLMLLFCIPIVGLLGMIYYAFIDTSNKERSIWAKNALIVLVIVYVILICLYLRIHNMTYPQFYNFTSKFFRK
jgi:hypothetical protein